MKNRLVICSHANKTMVCDIGGNVCKHAVPHFPLEIEWQGVICTERSPCGDGEVTTLVQCVDVEEEEG